MWDPEYEHQLSCPTSISQKAESEETSYPDGTAILKYNDGNEVPYEKVLEMRAYARKLKSNSPKMKIPRINKKIEDKFKIKLT